MTNYTDRRKVGRRLTSLSHQPHLVARLLADIKYDRTWKAKLNLKRLEDEQTGL